jgi:hypothetical protein
MKKPSGTARRCRSEIVLLHKADTVSGAGEMLCRWGSADTAPDDQHVKVPAIEI